MSTTSAKVMRDKRRAGVEITLPDHGDVVRVKPMDAAYFFKTGNIPDFLSDTVQKLINEPFGGGNTNVSVPTNHEKTTEWLTWLDELIIETFVEPKVVRERQNDDELGVDEISYFDKIFVYRLFGHPAYTLRNFRTGQAKPVEIVDAAKDNGTITQPAFESARVG